MPNILTTVVGSYPVPDWLPLRPTRQTLTDATRVVLKTQEEAGIDVVADGELYRFDLNHPETNGMIDYFVGQMSGVDTQPDRQTLKRFQEEQGLAYRSAPAGVVTGPLAAGTSDLPADCSRVRPPTTSKPQFTRTRPHMLSKVLLD